MKKKLLLLVSLIAVITTATLIFAGCSSATVQGQLENIWQPNEKFVYKVTDKSTPVEKEGQYIVTVKKNSQASLAFGDRTLENVPKGYIVEGELSFDGSQDKVKTACYFKMTNGMKYVSSYATYRYQQIFDGTKLNKFEMFGLYDGSTLNYEKPVYNDEGNKTSEIKKGSLSANEPFYDNNLLYQLLRSISTYQTSFSFSFNTPVVSETEDTVANLNISIANAVKVKNTYSDSLANSTLENKDDYKEGISCYAGAISRTASVVGMFTEVYIAMNPIPVLGWNIVHPIVKIVEPTNINQVKGSVTYELINIEI